MAEQAASDASAAAPKGLGEAAGAAKEAATGAAETLKDAAPSKPFAGFFGGGAMALQAFVFPHSRAVCLRAQANAQITLCAMRQAARDLRRATHRPQWSRPHLMPALLHPRAWGSPPVPRRRPPRMRLSL